MSGLEGQSRLERLLKALEIAERCGNTFMAANIKAAIKEETQREGPQHRV